MSGKNTTVFGIYPTHGSADAAVATLRAKGFRNPDISVLFPQNVGSKEFGHEKGQHSLQPGFRTGVTVDCAHHGIDNQLAHPRLTGGEKRAYQRTSSHRHGRTC